MTPQSQPASPGIPPFGVFFIEILFSFLPLGIDLIASTNAQEPPITSKDVLLIAFIVSLNTLVELADATTIPESRFSFSRMRPLITFFTLVVGLLLLTVFITVSSVQAFDPTNIAVTVAVVVVLAGLIRYSYSWRHKIRMRANHRPQPSP
jgi:predicted membrane channel-forming protein YqfA (hemolysin III family)